MEVKERKSPRGLISRSTGTGGGSFVFFFSTKDSKMKNNVHLLGMLPGVARKNV